MEVVRLLESQGNSSAGYAVKMVAMGVKDKVLLLESFSSLWQLAFIGFPWQVLLSCRVQQVLKGAPWPKSFSIALHIRHAYSHPLWSLSVLISCWCWHMGKRGCSDSSVSCV